MENDSLYQSEFKPDWTATKGNHICGDLTVGREGYLVTSIPFDPGFDVWIDGRRTETETVNTAFLGTKISKGNHKIEIVYHAPGVNFGKALSGIGVLLWLLAEAWARKKPKEKCTLVQPDAVRL